MKLKKLLKKSVKAVHQGKPLKYAVPCDLPAGAKFDREGNPVLPKTDGKCADLLYQLRESRLSIQRQLERFEMFESALRNHFVETLDARDQTGCAGALARVQIELRPTPQVEDWGAVYKYVRVNEAWELFQRRLNESAVKERWEAGEQIDGVTTFMAKKVSCVKL